MAHQSTLNVCFYPKRTFRLLENCYFEGLLTAISSRSQGKESPTMCLVDFIRLRLKIC